MIEFRVSREIKNPEAVWKVASDVVSIPKYWKGISRLDVQKVGDHYEGKVRFAFPSTSYVRIFVDDDNKIMKIEFTKGIIKGFNEVGVKESEIYSFWKVSESIILKPFEKRNFEHFKLGAEHALERIIESVNV
ncbi:SRPBCC family protein [Acidianus brierleyi]|uniref:SRPBCC family protein n=1 Tax=Acidianus brierleyi TaxID=41673 RepID=A0A2U9IDU3_9CREN|nr:SRPBCC family protein [Acidianus brierleyi]AWR94201.1 SRPBCC family protein [Acidianus brierleyi]